MMVRMAARRKCMKQIYRMKSRMGFHPEHWCCIVILVNERYEVISLPCAIQWPVI